MKTKLRNITAAAACLIALYSGIANAAASAEEAMNEAVARREKAMQELYPPRAGESVVLDPLTGDYKITYYNEYQKALTYATFVPSTKIDPTINSKLHLDKKAWVVNYGYSISSGEKSRQILNFIKLNLTGRVVGSQDRPVIPREMTPEQERLFREKFKAFLEASSRALSTPTGWTGEIGNHENGTSSVVIWHPDLLPFNSQAGILPKKHLKGLGFASLSLPGVGIVKFEGVSGELSGLPSVGPQSEIKQQLEKLRLNNYHW